MKVQFNVQFDMKPTELQGKNVLVFIAPPAPSRNITGLAWRVLTASPGAVESFEWNNQVSVAVDGHDADGKPVSTEPVTVQPGQMFAATRKSAEVLALESEQTNRLLPFQYGLTNRTDPGMQVDCTWYMAGAPAITTHALDSGMTTTFDGSNAVYFAVAEPPQVGEGVAQAFSDTTLYEIPVDISEVNVSLSLQRGMWVFEFK